LEECDQLHSGGALNNAWGFIPGEAAGAVLIGSHASQAHVKSHGQILAIGLAQETKLIKSEDVCIGEGLTQAFRQAFQSLPAGSSIDNIFCDMNGEAYRADEYGFTALRTKDRFRRPTDFIAPADCWGDVGAAGAALHLAMAVACCANGYGHGPLSLVWASSEAGQRGAVVVQAPFVARD
jgi:3-oxoacyl-[acyl-carrier-protein] synthase-1